MVMLLLNGKLKYEIMDEIHKWGILYVTTFVFLGVYLYFAFDRIFWDMKTWKADLIVGSMGLFVIAFYITGSIFWVFN